MDSMTNYDESTIIGTSQNRSRKYRDKTYIISRFDESGRKTDDLHTVTYGEMDTIIRDLYKALHTLGVASFDRIAVSGPNTPRWIYATFAALSIRGTFVPIYPTSKTDDVWWVLHDSSAKVLFCHGREQLDKALEVRDRLEDLEHIVVMDPGVEAEGPGVISFESLLDRGRGMKGTDDQIEARLREIHEDDLAAIIYTSGTTGRPKGVMLTHANFVSQRSVSSFFDFNPDDIWFGHLPMCHSFGLSSDLLNSGFQGGTLFISDTLEIEELKKNLKTCRPTVMSSVPRMWEKMYVQINTIVNQKPEKIQKIFHWALAVGRACFLCELEHRPVSAKLRIQRRVADRIFGKVKKEAGMDRLRITHTGGGPINKDMILFFGSMGIRLYQGFGLTETSPVTHTCTPSEHKLGWVGKPIPGTDCVIADDGEVLIRGPQVMKGYYNNPEATVEAMTEDGFFRTGDIGEIDNEGYLRITDRKKELIITRAGKNIAPQPIENAFNTDPYIEQVCVIGDDRKYLTALVIPNFPSLEAWAGKQGISWKNTEELVKDEKVRALMEERVALVNKDLARYETIKRFSIFPQEFTVEGGELTPTLKMKRRVIDEKYKDLIEDLYAST
ncbi:AMP-dependent synthetase/ligase [Thermodesulfobacteriota bacterium]